MRQFDTCDQGATAGAAFPAPPMQWAKITNSALHVEVDSVGHEVATRPLRGDARFRERSKPAYQAVRGGALYIGYVMSN